MNKQFGFFFLVFSMSQAHFLICGVVDGTEEHSPQSSQGFSTIPLLTLDDSLSLGVEDAVHCGMFGRLPGIHSLRDVRIHCPPVLTTQSLLFDLLLPTEHSHSPLENHWPAMERKPVTIYLGCPFRSAVVCQSVRSKTLLSTASPANYITHTVLPQAGSLPLRGIKSSLPSGFPQP